MKDTESRGMTSMVLDTQKQCHALASIHGFACVSDATRAPGDKSSLSLCIWPLQAFIASLYERPLSADIRFLMHSTICAII